MRPPPSPPDPLATRAVLALFGLNTVMDRTARALCAKHGVTSPAAFNVMAILDGEGGPLPPSQIAERMIVSRPAVTGVVASLAKQELVRVAAHPTDGRMSMVDLTDAGRRRVRDMSRELHDAESRWMAALTEDEQRQLIVLADRLAAAPPWIDADRAGAAAVAARRA